MQVKKFEAKTMKEALELVKVHLGPEAIILSAKDTHRGFGLMGDKSVEVTAAVSDETLRKKKIAETKLREELRQRFQQIPASQQKQFINKVFQNTAAENREMIAAGVAAEPTTPEVRAQTKGMRYIDISDESGEFRPRQAAAQRGQSAMQPRNQQAYGPAPAPAARVSGQQRVRNAAARAREAVEDVIEQQPAAPKRSARVTAAATAAARAAMDVFTAPPAQTSVASAQAATGTEARSTDVRALESQVRELKAIVERFQNVPQIPMTMHPGAEQGLSFELSGIYQRLTGQGVQPQLATSLLRKAHKEMDPEALKKPALVDAWAVRRLLETAEVSPNPSAARYHVFMGSSGQGKTTSLVKFASHLMLKEKKTIAIISLDSMRLGAADQLRLYAQILNVPFGMVRSPEEWRVAEQKLAHVNHILVDCPGLSLRAPEEVEWLRRMLPPAEYGRSTHFVQSILARDEETMEIATRYQKIGFADVIFTRLDESGRQGMILNFQDRFKVPLHSFSYGSRIPEDYEYASKERVVDFIFKLSKVTRREDPA
jgi:flagellar biosynthesis protein FlhF